MIVLQEEKTDAAAVSLTNRGALTLGVQDTAGESAKQLQVSVQRDGKTVSGSADVIGFPLIDSGPWGDVDWKVSGSTVTGIVRARDGEVEGMFEGTVTPTGVSGKFTHRDGRVGLWSWDGPPLLGGFDVDDLTGLRERGRNCEATCTVRYHPGRNTDHEGRRLQTRNGLVAERFRETP